MRRLLVSFALVALSSTALAAAPATGRWRGVVHVPGEELTVVVDLEQDPGGAWHGSATMPGLNLAATPLSPITATANHVVFSIAGALGGPPDGLATFAGDIKAGATLAGSFTQGGNAAPFVLRRSGPPEVERPAESTAVEAALEGTWRGDYQLTGYAHHVTLGFTNHPGAPATVEFLLVGKQPHTLAVDLVSEQEGLLRVESRELAVNFEGRVNSATGELAGIVEQGALEAPIVLKRVSGSGQ
jgi:hypothetical protein